MLPNEQARNVRWTIVGNPACRRVARFQKSLSEQEENPARLLDYAEIIDGTTLWRERWDAGDLVRLESAAEKWSMRRLLIAYGYEAALCEGYDAIAPDQLPDEFASDLPEIKPRQLFLGYRRVLEELDAALDASGAVAIQAPSDVACMFDKRRCQYRLHQSGVPIPPLLAEPQSYDQLRDVCGSSGRYMLKMAHGSGGVGCAALHWSRGRVRAFISSQTMRMAAPEHATLNVPVQQIDDEAVLAEVVDALCRESVHLEAWLPKARFEGKPFDFRVVVIAGRAQHAIARLGKSPFTNLNLGGQRRSVDQLGTRMSQDDWIQVERIAAQIAACFPDTLCFGLDLLRTPSGEFFALEVNAFGDFLLNVYQDGLDPYSAEIVAAEQWAEGRGCSRLADGASLA